jgi:hypothetical protein
VVNLCSLYFSMACIASDDDSDRERQRTAGWAAHWQAMDCDPHMRIGSLPSPAASVVELNQREPPVEPRLRQTDSAEESLSSLVSAARVNSRYR